MPKVKAFQRVHSLLVSELEKKYNQTVVLVGQVHNRILYLIFLNLSLSLFFVASNFTQTNTQIENTIETKASTKVCFFFNLFCLFSVFSNKYFIVFYFSDCFSRTLTAVHDAILHDLVYPAEITGKRIRIKLDGSRLFKVHLDKNQQTLVENKVCLRELICNINLFVFLFFNSRYQLFNQFTKNLPEKMFTSNFLKCSSKQ